MLVILRDRSGGREGTPLAGVALLCWPSRSRRSWLASRVCVGASPADPPASRGNASLHGHSERSRTCGASGPVSRLSGSGFSHLPRALKCDASCRFGELEGRETVLLTQKELRFGKLAKNAMRPQKCTDRIHVVVRCVCVCVFACHLGGMRPEP